MTALYCTTMHRWPQSRNTAHQGCVSYDAARATLPPIQHNVPYTGATGMDVTANGKHHTIFLSKHLHVLTAIHVLFLIKYFPANSSYSIRSMISLESVTSWLLSSM